MQAAVCYKFGKPLVVEEIDIDPPKQGVGSTSAMIQGFSMLCKRGLEVLVGIAEAGATVPFPAMQFLGERQVMGSALGSTRLSVDVPRLVDLYQHQRLKLDELITARYPLEQINEAIESMEKGEALRNVIVF
jgi:S-(hydroxymethyl)glutathione dehydrogenase/alcohol dehydrogenase